MSYITQQFTDQIERMRRELTSYENLVFSSGWSSIKYPEFQSHSHRQSIVQWCEDNCIGEFKNFSRTFYFKDRRDLVLFDLRWL